MDKPKGVIFTITGPSGTGKDTLMNKLIEANDNLQFFITATTRLPRKGEVHGKDYYFITKEEFKTRLKNGAFLEYYYNKSTDTYYGSPKDELTTSINAGINLISDLTWPGVEVIYNFQPKQTVSILLLPPSMEALAQRFAERRKQSGEDAKVAQIRMKQILVDAKHMEKEGYIFTNIDMQGSKLSDYNHKIINENLEMAFTELQQIVTSKGEKVI